MRVRFASLERARSPAKDPTRFCGQYPNLATRYPTRASDLPVHDGRTVH